MERKLVQVERGNVVLQVPEFDVQRFIDQGYNLTDGHGNILQASVPRDLGTLQKLYLEHTEKIRTLEDTIQKLKAQIKELKASKKLAGRKKKEDDVE